MLRNTIRRTTAVLVLIVFFAAYAVAQPAPAFNAAGLGKLGDHVTYGPYRIIKIGDGIYQINDPGAPGAKMGGEGVDMYLICGTSRALLVDLGNNYIDGYAQNLLPQRKNAAEEIRAVVFGLTGKLPLDIGITHAHPDHDGMTGAFANNKNLTIWMPEGEDINAPKSQFKIDPSVYTPFAPGKTFDLGGGRVVNTLLVRGHSNGGTVYLLKKDLMLFTGDALGSGFGQAFGTVERLKQFADDSQKLVDYLTANLSPYERYGLRVYTGHSWQILYGGFAHPNHDMVDVGFLDWRFVQDMASCASGILKGKWLSEGSGFQFLAKTGLRDRWNPRMIYGIGSIVIPLKTAYEAAGMQMPPDAPKK